MNFKGQIAFESLLVFLMVITSATLILTLYLQIHDDTVALEYAKIGTLEELSKQAENIIIEKIELQRNQAIPTITITLDKNTTINTTNIENTIKSNTKLQNIKIEVKSLRQ